MQRVLMLTPEDSKRVADALVRTIEDSDMPGAVVSAVRSVLRPINAAGWKEDWFPLCIEQMCDEISRGVTGAAYEAAERKGR